jgi:uncharacterized protein YkwD
MFRRRTLGAALVVGALAAPSSAYAVCPNEDLSPAAGNLDQVRAAVLCLHNEVRADRQLPKLKENTRLRKAAAKHSADMVEKGYFSHTAPDEDTFVDRILAAGYVRADEGWALGENLAWGTGELATPAQLMEAWMASSGHRTTLLRRNYRDVGFGIRLGVPTDAGVGVTVTADFGVKR